MRRQRPYVLSIAGFDPSGGAGVLADIKTFESHKVYGFGVISANTFQNDSQFESVDWASLEKIIEQVAILYKRFSFEYIKIGLVESLQMLEKLVSYLVSHIKNAKITWDPILSASAGHAFHSKPDIELLSKILPHLHMVTPNYNEAALMGTAGSAIDNARQMSAHCNVYLKGGHNEARPGYDTLFVKQGSEFNFKPRIKNISAKHGSGCVLSSALTVNLAKGERLQRACLKAKEYTEHVLTSNETLLGYHKL